MRSKNALTVAAWLTMVLTAVYVFAWLLPRKGVIMGDEGWYLAIARTMAEQGKLDLFLPQSPFYLPSALLMKAGLTGNLLQRYSYSALVGLSFLVFGAGLNRTRWWSFATPVGVSIGLMSTLNSLLSYHNGPVLMCLLALGCVFFAKSAHASLTQWALAGLGGSFLGCSLCINLVALPASLLTAGLCWLHLGRRGPAWMVPASCALVMVLFYSWYIPAISLAAFLKTPEGHGLDMVRLTLVLMVGTFCPLLGYVVTRFYSNHPMRKPLASRAAAWLAAVIAIFFALSPLYYEMRWNSAAVLTHSIILSPVHLIVYLSGIMLFTAYCVAGVDRAWPFFEQTVISCCCLLAYWMPQALFSDMALPLSLIFFAGPVLAVAVSLLASSVGPYFSLRSLCLCSLLVLTACLSYTLGWNHPGESRILGAKVPLNLPGTTGILETPERAETLARLSQAFDECGCREKIFIAFRFSSLLNFLFNKPSPEGLSYFSPDVSLQQDKIVRELASGQPWCVFYSRNFSALWWVDKEKPLIDYLESNSRRIVRIHEGPPRHPYDDFVIYEGPR